MGWYISRGSLTVTLTGFSPSNQHNMPRHLLLPTPTDQHPSITSDYQAGVEDDIAGLLLPWTDPQLVHPTIIAASETPGSRSIATAILDRAAHQAFLLPSLEQIGTRFTALDASRPWLLYWIINSLSILNLGLSPLDRQRAIDTLLSFQHPEGGFGGGPGQLAHLAPTFASIATLASLLGEADDQLVSETWARVDVPRMYLWMMSLKLSDGSFLMQQHGEADVRGIYCVLVVASLLNFLTPDLARGLPDFIAGCQTYEGGLGSASQLLRLGTRSQCVPLGEAHGGYTSCGLLSHFLLKSLTGSIPFVPFDYAACLRWLALMQALPIEGGGFRGRTNKLVDGCYSWWCGGLMPVISALIADQHPPGAPVSDEIRFGAYDRQGLQEYILLISQGQPPGPVPGGFRDKPSAPVDHYHTHYVLSGLSSAQNQHHFSHEEIHAHATAFDLRSAPLTLRGTQETLDQAILRARSVYSRALAWIVLEPKQHIIGSPENAVMPVHPVFNIRTPYVKKVMDHFYLKPS